ncbi:hypothetical protein MAP00_007907 [Monascus purpureus]|nr:hypothetical protein MAP00_007907 [Monascus purpureus]
MLIVCARPSHSSTNSRTIFKIFFAFFCAITCCDLRCGPPHFILTSSNQNIFTLMSKFSNECTEHLFSNVFSRSPPTGHLRPFLPLPVPVVAIPKAEPVRHKYQVVVL